MKGDAVKNDGRTLKGQQGHLESFGILAQEPLHTPKISDRQTSPQIWEADTEHMFPKAHDGVNMLCIMIYDESTAVGIERSRETIDVI